MQEFDILSAMESLEEQLGYKFSNKSILENALSHSSYVNEKKLSTDNNEKMEFFGDSILSFVISEHLFERLTLHKEGSLSKIRAAIVCEKSLSTIARKIDLGSSILLGKGELNSGGQKRISILADTIEAVIAAVFLDSGIESAKKVILKLFSESIEDAIDGNVFKDYKTTFQELIQKQEPLKKIEYKIIAEQGPDHNKIFTSALFIGDEKISEGKGKSKKEAQMDAARIALEIVKDETR